MQKKIILLLGIVLAIALIGVSYTNISKTEKEEKIEEIVDMEENQEMIVVLK